MLQLVLGFMTWKPVSSVFFFVFIYTEKKWDCYKVLPQNKLCSTHSIKCAAFSITQTKKYLNFGMVILLVFIKCYSQRYIILRREHSNKEYFVYFYRVLMFLIFKIVYVSIWILLKL